MHKPGLKECALVMIGASLLGCFAMTDPALAINGEYRLERVIGRGPAAGTLILTRQGYAERRVWFAGSDGAMSREYLARGSAELRSDSTIYLNLREMDPSSDIPWEPDARLVADGVQIRYYDVLDGSEIVEIYRRR